MTLRGFGLSPSGSAEPTYFDSGPGLAVFHQLRALVVEDQKVPVGFDEVLPGSVYSVGRLAFFWPTTMT